MALPSDYPSDLPHELDSQPIAPPDDEPVEQEIDETVGEIQPWQSVDVALEGWEYRVWDKWMGNDPKKADLLLDVLHQFDPTATMAKEQSKTNPESPDTVYSFHFSLYGSPDGVMDAITSINEAFLALDNYKVVAGKGSAIVTYPDGTDNLVEVPTKGGTDIDEALSWVVDGFSKSIGSKGEEEILGHKPRYAPFRGRPYHRPYQPQTPTTTAPSTAQPTDQAIPARAPSTQPELPAPESQPALTEPRKALPRPMTPISEICENHGTVWELHTPEDLDEDWSTIQKMEEGQCKPCKKGDHCFSQTPGCDCGCETLRPQYDTRMKYDEEITTIEEAIAKLEEKPWQPDLSYRGSPMGVEKALGEAKPEPKIPSHGRRPPTGKDLPGTETTDFDESGRPIYEHIEQEPTEPQPQWSKWRSDVATYSSEMIGLIDTILKLADDPTLTPEAMEDSAKVAKDRVKDIVKWAGSILKKVDPWKELATSPEDEGVLEDLQKIIEHGNHIQMLLINAEESSKMAAVPQ